MTEASCDTRGKGPRPSEPTSEEITALLDGLDVSSPSNLIGMLQSIQDAVGYLPPTALEELSRRARIPLSKIYGVVSFYAQFTTEPRGKHAVLCCRGTACHVKGAARIVDTVCETLGVGDGESTDDMLFHLETVACLGTCFLAPVIMIDNQYYGNLTAGRVESILDSYRSGS